MTPLEHSQLKGDMRWTFTDHQWHVVNIHASQVTQFELNFHTLHLSKTFDITCHPVSWLFTILIHLHCIILYCILYFIMFYTNVSLFLTKKMSKEIYWFILFSAIPDRSVKQVMWNLINMFSRYVSKTLLLSINFKYHNHKEIALIGTVGQHVAQAVSATKMAADSQTQDSSHILA